MVARRRLGGAPLVLLELLLRRERGAVDALQPLVLLVALPVDGRRLEQLDRADLLQVAHVRPAAEVVELAVAIDGDRLAVGNVLEALDLEALAALAEEARRLVARDLDALEGASLGEDLAHLRLDLLQIVGRERLRAAEVVLELLAVVDAADVDLDLGPQSLDRVGHHVLGAVAHEPTRLGVLGGEDAEPAAATQRRPQIDVAALELGADRGVGEAGPDRARGVERGDAALDRQAAAVG